MPQYFLDVYSNGVRTKDRRGRHFENLQTARTSALSDILDHLRREMSATGAYTAIHIRNHEGHELAIIRGSLAVEMRSIRQVAESA
jgi:hypothetical protein